MPSVQITNVPHEVYAVLRRRAAEENQSLQDYLRAHLIAEAARPTLDEVLNRAGGRAGGSLSLNTSAQIVRRDRATLRDALEAAGGYDAIVAEVIAEDPDLA
jgi:hypothetical protein